MGKVIAIIGLVLGLVLGGAVPLVLSARDILSTENLGKYEGPTEVLTVDAPFLVPIVVDGVQEELLTVSLAFEIQKGWGEKVETIMPRIRHEMLQVLYKQYHKGGFSDNFMRKDQLDRMMFDMTEAARKASDAKVQKVLLQGLFKQTI